MLEETELLPLRGVGVWQNLVGSPGFGLSVVRNVNQGLGHETKKIIYVFMYVVPEGKATDVAIM